MSSNSAQSLPPKMAQQFAERARRGEGHRLSGDIYEFPQFGNVVVIMLGPMIGHVVKDPRRAQELRDILSQAASNPKATS